MNYGGKMKSGYLALVLITCAFGFAYGLLDQLNGHIAWAFGYICLILFGGSIMYLIGHRLIK